MTPRRCFVREESDGDGRSGENRSERSSVAKMEVAVASQCCSANGEEQRGKWSGAVFRRERRSVCVHLRHPREWSARSGEGREQAARGRRSVAQSETSAQGDKATPSSIGEGSSVELLHTRNGTVTITDWGDGMVLSVIQTDID